MTGSLAENGIALVAISYDPVDVLAGFAERYGIAFPLLSDEGSETIKRLGLLNERIHEQHEAFGIQRFDAAWGVPYPGVFVLDESGVVVDKRFTESYRERETGSGLLEQALHIASPVAGPAATASAGEVGVRAWFDSPTFALSQRLWLNVELAIEPGWHIYTDPIPAGYVPVRAAMRPARGLRAGEPAYPGGHPFRVAGLDEQFHVLEGKVRLAWPVVFGVPPGSGDQAVQVDVSWQACSERECLPPTTVTLDLAVAETDLIERPVRR